MKKDPLMSWIPLLKIPTVTKSWSLAHSRNKLNACETAAVLNPSKCASIGTGLGLREGFAVDLTKERTERSAVDYGQFRLPPPPTNRPAHHHQKKGQIRSNKIGQIRPNKVGQMRPNNDGLIRFGPMRSRPLTHPSNPHPSNPPSPPTHDNKKT